MTTKEKVSGGIKSFKAEFKKHIATFITGAFTFVAALLWRDAITSYINAYQHLIKAFLPVKEIWAIQLMTALLVSAIAVAAIMLISRILKND